MRKHGFWAAVVAFGFGLVALGPHDDVAAKPAEKKKASAPSTQPAPLEQVPDMDPKGLRFGMSQKDLIKLYDRVIDQDYLKRWEETEPGVEQERLKTEIDQKKQDFKTSFVSFDDPPSSYDGGLFTAEFAYGAGESAMKIDRKGRWRYYFLSKNKVYKVIEVEGLGESSRWGADFKTAIEKLEKKIGTPGRKLAADPAKGRPYEEVDWADAKTHFRVINYEKKIGFAWVDKDIESRLGELRTAKEEKKEDVDQKVKDVLRDPKQPEPPPKGAKDKGPKGKQPKGKQ